LALALIALAPIAANHHLRNVYRQTLAHWLSKIIPPPTVFIGDSITAGGQWFDNVRNINLAANGLLTDQIVKYLPTAQAYRPKRIVIMAGANDAARGFDPDKLRGLWETICKEPSIIITLAPPSRDDETNRRIDQINRIAMDSCPGKPVITLDVGDEHGRLRPEFTLYGTHLGPKAYEQWVQKLTSSPLIEETK
jgi:lysophospholipase L1-like esterase